MVEIQFIFGVQRRRIQLTNAKFERSILEKADLRTALHYSIHPEMNRIKKAKFAFPAVTGLLDQYDIVIE